MLLKDDENVDVVISQLMSLIQELGNQIRLSDDITIKDKLAQMDVLVHTMHFLKEYDINKGVLHRYWLNNHSKDTEKDL